jgi:hypothetical protein
MAITLPSKFETELNKIENQPSILLSLTESFLFNTQTTEADWTANSSESNVDYNTIVGSVILAQDTIPTQSQGTSGTGHGLIQVLTPPVTSSDPAWQTFKHTDGDGLYINTVKVYLSTTSIIGTAGATVTIRDSGGSAISSTKNITVTGSSETAYTVDFSAENIKIDNNTTYQVYLTGSIGAPPGSSGNAVILHYNSAGGYANGQLIRSSDLAVLGDARFEITFFGTYYKLSGSIETQNMALDETPTVDGEWVIFDDKNGETLTYTAEGSATGAWAGEEVALGSIVDGQAITGTKYKYYRVTASFTTTDRAVSPELQEITVNFATIKKFSDNDFLGYEPSIESISSLTTQIGDFKNTTIGQLTVTMSRTSEVEDFFLASNIYPKNKPASLQFGFILEDKSTTARMNEAEYLIFFSGVIDNYRVTKDNKIVVVIKDTATQLDVQIPKSTDPTPADIVYTNEHHIDVMLDILQDRVEIRDSQIDLTSFDTVKTALSGWEVTRTITHDEQESAKKLLEELRTLINCYLVPKTNGKISIKQWNASETQADAWTDDDYISITWDRNSKSLVNQMTTYFDWAGTGDDFSDYNELTITVDSTSISNYEETREKILKDKWTDVAEASQITTYNAAIIARYADPPGILDIRTDLKKLKYEAGDIIDITASKPIGTAEGGITNEHFQITNKNLDWQNGTIDFKLLQVAGD